MDVTVSKHFIFRARERLAYDHAQAQELGEGLFWAIDRQREDLVEFIGRVSRDGKRLFRFRAANGRHYYALLDTESRTCVTVLPPGYTAGREGKSYIKLRDTDL